MLLAVLIMPCLSNLIISLPFCSDDSQKHQVTDGEVGVSLNILKGPDFLAKSLTSIKINYCQRNN